MCRRDHSNAYLFTIVTLTRPSFKILSDPSIRVFPSDGIGTQFNMQTSTVFCSTALLPSSRLAKVEILVFSMIKISFIYFKK